MSFIRGARCAPAKVMASPTTIVYVAARCACKVLAPECSAVIVGQVTNAYEVYIEPNITTGIAAMTHFDLKDMSTMISIAGTRSNTRFVVMYHNGSGNHSGEKKGWLSP